MKYGPVAYYEVRWKPVEANEEWEYKTYPADTTTITISTHLRREESYYIEARSVGPSGLKSVWVDISHTVDGNVVPEVPITLVAAGLADGIRLTWSTQYTPSPGTIYCIERSTDGSTGWVEVQQSKTKAATILEKVDGTYYYRIRSLVGTSTYSAYSSVVSGSPNTLAEMSAQITASQTDATNALSKLTDIANDNLLTPGEKPVVIQDRDKITDEQASLDSEADAYGVSRTAYDNSITALTSYLATLTSPVAWDNLSGNTTIVRTTFYQKFKDVYNAKTALLVAIYDAARTKAELAQLTASNHIRPNKFWQFAGASLPSGTSTSGISTSGADQNTTTRLTATNTDPILNFNGVNLAPSGCHAIAARIKVNSGSWQGTCFYTTAGHAYSSSYCKTVGAPKTGVWTTVVWDMRDLTTGGTDFLDAASILDVRLDFGGNSSSVVDVDWVAIGTFGMVSQADVTAAQTAATNAQTDATNSLNQLSDISNDNLLTPAEKKIVIQDRDALTGEQAGIDAQATAFGIVTEKTAYDNAVSALTSYLATLTSPVLWSNMSGNTTIVRNTFKQKFLDVYSTRQALLNTIYEEAKYIADGKVQAAGANMVPNPTFVLNNYGVPNNVGQAQGADIADGWYNDVISAGNTNIRWYSTSTGILTQVGNPSMLNSSNSYASIRTKEKIPVDGGANYLVDWDAAVGYTGTLNAGFSARYRIAVMWYDADDTYISPTIAADVARGTARPVGARTITAPTNAVYCAIQCYSMATNTSGASGPPVSGGSLTMRTTWNWVSLVKQVQTTAYLPMLMWGGNRAKVPTVITYSASAGVSNATATINVAAFSVISGIRTISYSAMSVGVSGAKGSNVQYFLYVDDPTSAGGSQTLVATTNGDNVYASEGRLYIGDVLIAFPTSGSGSGGGGRVGDSCVCIDMFLLEDLMAVEARENLLIDCLDLPVSDKKFKRRIKAVRFSEEECVELRSDDGAVLRLSAGTPFDLLTGGVKFADHMLGELVVTDKGIAQIVSCEPIGRQPVARISVGGVSYAAGEDPTNRIYSHNTLKP